MYRKAKHISERKASMINLVNNNNEKKQQIGVISESIELSVWVFKSFF